MSLAGIIAPFFGPLGSAALAFPVAASAIALPFALWHYRRHGRIHPWRAIVGYSFVFYLIVAVFLVILPLPDLPRDTGTEAWNARYLADRSPNLDPLDFWHDIRFANDDTWRARAVFQALFNAILLLPFGAYLVYLFKARVLVATLSGFLLSLLFELCQLTGDFWIYPGPYRLFDTGDLLLNTGGAFLGSLAAALLVRSGILPELASLKGPDSPWIGSFRRALAILIDVTASLLVSLAAAWGLERAGIDVAQPVIIGIPLAFWLIALPALDGGRGLGKRLTFCAVRKRNGKPAGVLRILARQAATWAPPLLVQPLANLGTWGLAVAVSLGFFWLALVVANILGVALGKEKEGWLDRKLGTRVRNTWKLTPSPRGGRRHRAARPPALY